MSKMLVKLGFVIMVLALLALCGLSCVSYGQKDQRFVERSVAFIAEVYERYPPSSMEKRTLTEVHRIGDHYIVGVSGPVVSSWGYAEGFIPPKRVSAEGYTKAAIVLPEFYTMDVTEEEAAVYIMREMTYAAQFAASEEYDDEEAEEVATLFTKKVMSDPEFYARIPRAPR